MEDIKILLGDKSFWRTYLTGEHVLLEDMSCVSTCFTG